jgi:hypothetical protein
MPLLGQNAGPGALWLFYSRQPDAGFASRGDASGRHNRSGDQIGPDSSLPNTWKTSEALARSIRSDGPYDPAVTYAPLWGKLFDLTGSAFKLGRKMITERRSSSSAMANCALAVCSGRHDQRDRSISDLCKGLEIGRVTLNRYGVPGSNSGTMESASSVWRRISFSVPQTTPAGTRSEALSSFRSSSFWRWHKMPRHRNVLYLS